MENNKLQYSTTDTPWYFGAYLNMARHNCYLLINHLTDRYAYLNFKPITNDEDIGGKNILTQIFNPAETINTEDRFRVFKYLIKKHYFPCIKLFHEQLGKNIDTENVVDYASLNVFINTALQLLNSQRNSFSHYLAINDAGEKEETKPIVTTPNFITHLGKLFKHAPEFSLERYHLNEDHFKHTDLYELKKPNTLNELSEHGLYFFINLFLEKKYAILFLKKISGFKNETLPPFKATIQTFTAYSVTIPDFRLYNEDNKSALLLNILGYLQKCPIELYRHLTEEDKIKFTPILGNNAKYNMLENTNYDNQDTDIAAIEAYLSEIISLKRDQSKYAYFFLNFIDEFNLLPNIHFHINIGKLIKKEYTKTIADEAINRRLIKQINGFGKLAEFQDKESVVLELIRELIPNATFEQYAPHYLIEGNKIGFYQESNNNLKISGIPPYNKATGFISLNDLPKLLLLALLNQDKPENLKGKNDAEKAIIDFLKKNKYSLLNISWLNKQKNKLDLNPATITRRIVKLNSLKGKRGKYHFLNSRIEQVLLSRYNLTEEKLLISDIKNICRRSKKDAEQLSQLKYRLLLELRKNKLQKILPEHITPNQLPTEIINYLLNIEPVASSKKAHLSVKALHKDCEDRLKQISKDLEKENGSELIKFGLLAEFLARDIISMIISEQTKQVITSAYYRKIQFCIAYFSVEKKQFIQILEEVNLFDKIQGHVFLKRKDIIQSPGVIDFYINYLTKKKNWIKTLYVDGRGGGYKLANEKVIPYSFQKLNKKQKVFEEWLENKKAAPTDFPRTYFDVYRKALLNTLTKETEIGELAKLLTPYKDENIAALLEKALLKDCQPYYNFKRVYKINRIEELIDTTIYSGKLLKEKYGVHVDKNEKKIRFYLMQDRLLLLVLQYIIKNTSNHSLTIDTIKLKNINPLVHESLLNQPYEFNHKLDKKYTIIAKDTSKQRDEVLTFLRLTSEEERNEYKGQKGFEWTLKDFGRFKKIVKDRRISELVNYFDYEDIALDFIIYQLQEYDSVREKIFMLIFNLEEILAKQYFTIIQEKEINHRLNLIATGKPKLFQEVQFDIYIDLVKEKSILTEREQLSLFDIRNKFSHSEFPLYSEDINKLTKADEAAYHNSKKESGKLETLNISIAQKLLLKLLSITQKIETTI